MVTHTYLRNFAGQTDPLKVSSTVASGVTFSFRIFVKIGHLETSNANPLTVNVQIGCVDSSKFFKTNETDPRVIKVEPGLLSIAVKSNQPQAVTESFPASIFEFGSFSV